MYKILNTPEKLTFDWLFDRITQEEVFLRYFGFCDMHIKFCNPLRNDNDPGCSFNWNSGVLFFSDYSTKKSYTCVNVVMESEGINYPRALDRIYEVFINNNSNIITNKVIRVKEPKKPKDIKCKIQSFTSIDIQYLKQFGITSKFCKLAKWYSIKHYWIDGELMYTYSNYNPCIGYYFNGRWKLYFYLNKEWRFLSNTTKNDIQGWNILPKIGDLLIITKSFKDVGTLYEQEISSISPQAESILLPENIINDLKLRFTTIYTLFDYDNTGIHLAWQMRKLYNIKPLFFTNKIWNRKGGYMGCKDASDYRKLFGKDELKNLTNDSRM